MSGTTVTEDVPLVQRVRENPRPALIWLAGLALLVLVEFGAVASSLAEVVRVLVELVPGDLGMPTVEAFMNSVHAASRGFRDWAQSIPTLLSRDLIPNQGHQTAPGSAWEGTFLGLPPAIAWAIRVVVVYVYAFLFLIWLVVGYEIFRENYRYADWTPRDDVWRRIRSHRWGQFGFVVVFMFVVLAIFAPTLGPTTVDQNIANPYEHEIQYLDEETGNVQTTLVGTANLQAASQGDGSRNTGPLTYDDYGRFHPFGTLPSPGKDLFTFMAAGARISLFIGLVAIGISIFLAAVFGLLTAYYKGLVDLGVVLAGDSVMSMPQLLLIILVSVVFSDSWLGQIYSGGLLLALIFAFTTWPFLWRSVRGPAFQVAEQEWVDAARSYGQRARTTMRKHMLPYIVGYLLIYGSMSLGGIIISTAALSFLGLGVQPPTPEWGRAINMGQSYVATQSWHISFIPGVLIVLVVTGFNALGDGIRDAIDPQSSAAGSGTEAAAAGGGG